MKHTIELAPSGEAIGPLPHDADAGAKRGGCIRVRAAIVRPVPNGKRSPVTYEWRYSTERGKRDGRTAWPIHLGGVEVGDWIEFQHTDHALKKTDWKRRIVRTAWKVTAVAHGAVEIEPLHDERAWDDFPFEESVPF